MNDDLEIDIEFHAFTADGMAEFRLHVAELGMSLFDHSGSHSYDFSPMQIGG